MVVLSRLWNMVANHFERIIHTLKEWSDTRARPLGDRIA
jgi:hypothetical protein